MYLKFKFETNLYCAYLFILFGLVIKYRPVWPVHLQRVNKDQQIYDNIKLLLFIVFILS